jgi:hypothetical protein
MTRFWNKLHQVRSKSKDWNKLHQLRTIPVAADAPTIAAVLSVDFEGIGSDVVVAIQKL